MRVFVIILFIFSVFFFFASCEKVGSGIEIKDIHGNDEKIFKKFIEQFKNTLKEVSEIEELHQLDALIEKIHEEKHFTKKDVNEFINLIYMALVEIHEKMKEQVVERTPPYNEPLWNGVKEFNQRNFEYLYDAERVKVAKKLATKFNETPNKCKLQLNANDKIDGATKTDLERIIKLIQHTFLNIVTLGSLLTCRSQILWARIITKRKIMSKQRDRQAIIEKFKEIDSIRVPTPCTEELIMAVLDKIRNTAEDM